MWYGFSAQSAFLVRGSSRRIHDCAVSTRGYQSDQLSHWPLVLPPALSLQFAEARLNLNLDTVAPYQKVTFSASCKMRGSYAYEIVPKPAAFTLLAG